MSPKIRSTLQWIQGILLIPGFMSTPAVGLIVWSQGGMGELMASQKDCPEGHIMVPLHTRKFGDPRYGCLRGVLP